MELVTIKDLSIVCAGVVAFVGLVSGYVEYSRRNRFERIQSFLEMRQRFQTNENFKQMLNLVALNDPKIKEFGIQDRRHLAGFLEEVGLLVQNKVIRIDIAHYMFGVYVEAISKCEMFWDGLEPKSEYWTVFRKFDADLADHRKKISANVTSKF